LLCCYRLLSGRSLAGVPSDIRLPEGAARAAHGEILRGCHLLPRGAAPPFLLRSFSPDPGRAGRGTSAAKAAVPLTGGRFLEQAAAAQGV